MNPYVQYIESRGNLVALKDLSSMWGVFNTHHIASWTLGTSPSTLKIATSPRAGWSNSPLPMHIVMLATTLKVYTPKAMHRYGLSPVREGDWWVLSCNVDGAQPRREMVQANHRADVSNGWRDLFKGSAMA